ncbi:phosphatidylglycerol lysyltransferase domain-containing protein, partial [Cellulomonas rhizosphaerae]
MTETQPERRLELHHGSDDRWPDRFAAVMFAFAIFAAVVAVVPPWRSYFDKADDAVSMLSIPMVPSFVYVTLLFVIAVALRRRLRAAWWVLVVWWLILPALGRLDTIAAGEHLILASIGLVVLVAALVLAVRVRHQFVARRVPGSFWTALAVFLGGGAVILFGGAALVVGFGDADDYGQALRYVFGDMLTDLGRVGLHGDASAPWWVAVIVGVLGTVVIVVAATILFRPPQGSRTLAVSDEARVRAMLRDHGEHDSLGYFATRRDKSVVWDTGEAATARAGVSYRVIGSVSLASGNPIGDPLHWPVAIQEWRRLARDSGL